LLNLDSFPGGQLNNFRVGAALQVAEQEAGKVGMHPFILRNELVGEGEARHETSLRQPEGRSKGAGKEDALAPQQQ